MHLPRALQRSQRRRTLWLARRHGRLRTQRSNERSRTETSFDEKEQRVIAYVTIHLHVSGNIHLNRLHDIRHAWQRVPPSAWHQEHDDIAWRRDLVRNVL